MKWTVGNPVWAALVAARCPVFLVCTMVAVQAVGRHAEAQPPTGGSAIGGQPQSGGRVIDKTLINDVADRKAAANQKRAEKLAKYLSGKDFVGRYTTDNGDGNPAAERYTISSCKTTNMPDLYEMNVRIQYGGRDVTVPLRVMIYFAEKTPVITVDRMIIPGMGTFDARVIIRNDRYAGTWRHDDHGGHLFGRIEPTPVQGAEEAPKVEGNADKSEKPDRADSKN